MIKLHSFNEKLHSIKLFKLKFFFSFLGFCIVVIGFLLTFDIAIELFGWISRFCGDLFQILGVILITGFFLSIPSLIEFTWQEKVDNIFLLLDSGICIYYKYFKDEEKKIGEQMITGAINSIRIILRELTKKEGLSIIEKEGKVIYIEKKGVLIGVVIAEEYLFSIEFLLDKLMDKISLIYSKTLESWRGELKIFNPIDDIVRDIFC